MKILSKSLAVIALATGLVLAAGVAPASAADFVSVPDRYVYNPDATYQRTLHDYCTMSPDEFSAPGTNASFRGPCARHDLCIMDRVVARSTCDSRFKSNLLQQCEHYYGSWDPRRAACKSTALTYYAVVSVKTKLS